MQSIHAPLDTSVFSANAINYTANPLFGGSAVDPLPNSRVAVLSGKACVDPPSEDVIDDLLAQPDQKQAGNGVDHSAAVEFVPREFNADDDLEDAAGENIMRLIRSSAPEGARSSQFQRVVNKLYLQGFTADDIYRLFARHPHGVAQKYAQRGDLEEQTKASWAHAGPWLAAHGYRRTQDRTTDPDWPLIEPPADAPKIEPEFIGLEELREELTALFNRIIADLMTPRLAGEHPAHGVNAPVGVGKTEELIKQIVAAVVAYCQDNNSNFQAAIAVPDHFLSAELEKTASGRHQRRRRLSRLWCKRP